jgi:fluoride exporter
VTILIICIAGGVGALTRFIIDGLIRSKLGRRFPWGTIFINVSGALLLGIITSLTLRHDLSITDKLIVGTGFCGGYTTFSTASFEAVRLLEEKRLWAAAWHVFMNIGLTTLAAVIALYIF